MCTHQKPPERDTMTIQELAYHLGIGLSQAYEMARTNRLPVPVLRVGKQYRFSRRAYEALMNANADGPTRKAA